MSPWIIRTRDSIEIWGYYLLICNLSWHCNFHIHIWFFHVCCKFWKQLTGNNQPNHLQFNWQSTLLNCSSWHLFISHFPILSIQLFFLYIYITNDVHQLGLWRNFHETWIWFKIKLRSIVNHQTITDAVSYNRRNSVSPCSNFITDFITNVPTTTWQKQIWQNDDHNS